MDHPKFIALDAGAWRLWCEGNTYCQRQLTNGFIPSTAVKKFRYYTARAQKQLLEALVPNKGPLWERADGGFQMHDYLDWNDSAEKVLKARKDAKDRLEKWKAEQAAKRNGTRLPETPTRNAFQVGARNASKRNGTEQSVDTNHQQTSGARYDERRPHPLDERPVLSPEAVEAGNRFLAAYPVKQNQAAAKRAWTRLNPDENTIAAIFANLEAREGMGWSRNARFIPYPARFLEDRMWEETYIPRDAPPAAEPIGRAVPDADATEAYLATLRAARG